MLKIKLKLQNDLKDERRRAQMAAARQVLERSTMMLLTSSKACLRHPECPFAKENRDTVFCQMRRAMDLIHYVVKDGVLDCSESAYSNSQVIFFKFRFKPFFTKIIFKKSLFTLLIEIFSEPTTRRLGK